MSPVVVAGTVGVLAVAITVWALADLVRHDVEHLPKWAWAACIVLLSVIGVVVYLVAGRVPTGGDRPLLTRLVGQADQQTSADAEHELMLVGMVVGLLIGTALGQLVLGMAVGMTVGAIADAYRSKRAGR